MGLFPTSKVGNTDLRGPLDPYQHKIQSYSPYSQNSLNIQSYYRFLVLKLKSVLKASDNLPQIYK